MDEVSPRCHLQVDATPLLEAARRGRIKLVRILTEGGADIGARNATGQGVLAVAVASDDVIDGKLRLQMVRYLLQHGADVDGTDKLGRTPLIHACLSGVGRDVVRVLVDAGSDVLHRDKFDRNSLEYARQVADHAVTSLLAAHFGETLRRPVAPPVRRADIATGGDGSGELATDSCDAQLRRQLFRKKKSISLQESVTKDDAASTCSDEPVQWRDRKLRRRHTTNMSDRCRELFDKLEKTKDHSEQAEVLGDVLSTLIKSERNLWHADPEQQDAARGYPEGVQGGPPRAWRETSAQPADDPEASGAASDADIQSHVSGSDATERSGAVSNRLLDHLSVTRPGQLPALNVNLAKPIPGIVKLDTPANIQNDRPR